MKTIPIFFSFDDNYVKPAAVAFWSLLDKADKNVSYDMYVLHHDISKENQAFLSSIVEKAGNARLIFKDTGGFLLNEWREGNYEGHQTRTQFTSDTLVRCFAATMFPYLDKVIYSDVDVVFADDISELWDIDVSDVYLAGVKNVFMKHEPNELSHLKSEHYEMLKDKYLAGGIWLMNLKKIREDAIEAKMMDVIKDDTIIKRWNDQDIINIACAGKVGFIPLNYISYPYLLDYIRRPGFISHYSREELYDSYVHPKIIHYALEKPWNGCAERQEIWWAIHDLLGMEMSSPPGLRANEKKALLKKCAKLTRRYKRCLVIMCIMAAIWAVFVGRAVIR